MPLATRATTLLLSILMAAPVAAVPFDQSLELQGISFQVQCPNGGSINTVTITPSGLKVDNSVITREADGLGACHSARGRCRRLWIHRRVEGRPQPVGLAPEAHGASGVDPARVAEGAQRLRVVEGVCQGWVPSYPSSLVWNERLARDFRTLM